MSPSIRDILAAAQRAFDRQEAEAALRLAHMLQRIQVSTASGSGDMNNTFSLSGPFRLVYIRCHFVGGTGVNPLRVILDHRDGSAYDVQMQKINGTGTGSDVNFTISPEINAEPSPWTFQAGDAVRLEWTNPDSGNMSWGLEIGLAPVWQPPRTAAAGGSP